MYLHKMIRKLKREPTKKAKTTVLFCIINQVTETTIQCAELHKYEPYYNLLYLDI
jgi:hypothetical protein